MFRALRRLFERGALDPRQLLLPFEYPPSYPLPSQAPQMIAPAPRPTAGRRPPRRPARRSPAEEDVAASAKLTARHAEFNAAHFDGALRPIRIEVSRRLRSRLGYYRVASTRHPGLIVISRRHLRRHGWTEVYDTLLHEMVHQWQDENGLSVDHGPQFRAKARAVGVVPRARRPVG